MWREELPSQNKQIVVARIFPDNCKHLEGSRESEDGALHSWSLLTSAWLLGQINGVVKVFQPQNGYDKDGKTGLDHETPVEGDNRNKSKITSGRTWFLLKCVAAFSEIFQHVTVKKVSPELFSHILTMCVGINVEICLRQTPGNHDFHLRSSIVFVSIVFFYVHVLFMMTRTYKESRAEQENYIYKPRKNCAQACFSFFPSRNGETEKKL